MKILKRLLIFLLLLPILGIAGGWFYLNSLKTDYNENTSLPGLGSEVEVYFDEYAIPHIYADNEPDAFRAFGYLHAKERLWQMELLRRLAPGRLSEILGEGTLKTDQFFRLLGLSDYSKASVEHFNNELDPKIRENVMAYLGGINQFIDDGKTPVEYTIVGLEKSHFTPEDIYNIMGYMAFSFAMAHKTEPILSYVMEKYGPEYLNDLDVQVDSNSTIIWSGTGAVNYEGLSMHIDDMMNKLPVSPFIGSNSWVVSGSNTKTGKVLFANDPHIGFSQPAVWYEAHLNTPDLNLYGYWLAGYPFPQLIHTDHHAIGLTMFENDDIDLFREKLNPDNANQYFYKGEWRTFEKREETIQVKDGDAVMMTVKSSVHGPVINAGIESLADSDPVSMWWTYTQHTNLALEANYHLYSAKSIDDVQKAAAMIHAPGLNVMYGDKDGNIGWWACAKLPIRPDHVNSKLILDGTGADDPLGYYDFSENPKAVNPLGGYVYSANNQSRSPTGRLHPGYYLPEDRARRIVMLMDLMGSDWSVDNFKTMMTDPTSLNAPEIVQSMVAAVDPVDLSDMEKMVWQHLQTWTGEYSLDGGDPVVYQKLMYHISAATFTDEMGEGLFDVFNGNHLMKRSIQPLFANDDSRWWDDVNTPDVRESRSDIMTRALQNTVSEIVAQLGENPNNWHWKDVHTLEHNHAFSKVPSLKDYFNVGPFPVPGNTETLNNMHCRLQPDGTYEVFAGPSTRRIVDFADVAGNSWSILPTGQSGNVMSPHYSDQAEMFAKGEFRRQLMDKEEILKGAKYKAVFKVK